MEREWLQIVEELLPNLDPVLVIAMSSLQSKARNGYLSVVVLRHHQLLENNYFYQTAYLPSVGGR